VRCPSKHLCGPSNAQKSSMSSRRLRRALPFPTATHQHGPARASHCPRWKIPPRFTKFPCRMQQIEVGLGLDF
jgi:hypothetical protein